MPADHRRADVPPPDEERIASGPAGPLPTDLLSVATWKAEGLPGVALVGRAAPRAGAARGCLRRDMAP